MRVDKQAAIQFMRYCQVGFANTIVDFSVFYLLIAGEASYVMAQVASSGAGMINSFLLNRKWTFQVSDKIRTHEIMKFALLNGISMLLSSGLLLMLIDWSGLPLWINKLAATTGGMFVNYSGSRFWVFAHYQETRKEDNGNQEGCNPRSRHGNQVPSSHEGSAERNAADCG
ncbi:MULTISPECIES: GtrA family protein [Paenibacillus]|uniref:GtrA family protein n=1 Tax=Paenibacillus TaxID=44249 RepID=UPI0013DC0A96|nr:GtrA family protein [Paenibacillus alvei]NEZ42474.1 GtrA family protein [Paenibacillus alvei]